MKLSAIICTYQRERWLLRALESLAGQRIGSGHALEIVVVDNDPDAARHQRLEQLVGESGIDARVIWERRQGIGPARNRGVEEAAGEVLAFLDDDAFAHPGWAAAALALFERTSAQVATGPVYPAWEVPPPSWLVAGGRFLTPTLALNDLVDGRLPPPLLPPGCNMATGRSLFDRGHRFGTAGHRGREVIGAGEESALFARLLRDGVLAPERMLFCRAMAVDHLVPAERMTRDFYLHRQHVEGRAACHVDRARYGLLTPFGLGLARVGLNVVRDLPLLCRAALGGAGERVPLALCRLQRTRGYLEGLLSG